MTEKMVTPVFRGSFVYLNTPHAPPAKPGETPKEKYSITAVFKRDDKEQMAFIKLLKKKVVALRDEKFGDPKVKKYKFKSPIKDGNDEVVDGWEDAYIVMASSDRQPGVVGVDKQPVIDPEELYSGAYYRMSVTLYAWDHPTGGKGISVSLSNVMKIKNGEPFDGRTTAEADFEDVDDYDEDMDDDDDDDGIL